MSGWRDSASCIGNPHVFEPDDRGGTHDWETPRAICRACPVQQACLADALAHETGSSFLRWGMRGGLTPSQRAAMSRGQKVTPDSSMCGTVAGAYRHRRRSETVCAECLAACAERARATRKSRAKAVSS